MSRIALGSPGCLLGVTKPKIALYTGKWPLTKGIIRPVSLLYSWHWVLLFWQLTVEGHCAPTTEEGDEECQAKNIYESIRNMTITITISQFGIIFMHLNKACHICRWKHQNRVFQQSFHGDRLFSVWQVHWQELFQLAACNSKQSCSCLSGVFLTISNIHKTFRVPYLCTISSFVWHPRPQQGNTLPHSVCLAPTK